MTHELPPGPFRPAFAPHTDEAERTTDEESADSTKSEDYVKQSRILERQLSSATSLELTATGSKALFSSFLFFFFQLRLFLTSVRTMLFEKRII